MAIGGRSVGTVAKSLIGLGAIVLIFFFLIRGLASNWGDLQTEDIDVQPALLLLSGLLLAGAILLYSVVWAGLISHFAGREPLPLGRLAKVFLYSWMGRYVPGKVAYPVGRFFLGRSLGFSPAALIRSLAYENVLLLVAAFALASVTLVPSLATEWASVLPYLALPVLAVGGVMALHPRVLRWALRFVLQRLGREPADVDWLLSPRQLAKVLALYMGALCLSGVGFYLLILSLTSYSPRYLPLAVGVFALAGIIGMISVFAPAGIGVREGVLVAVLQVTMPLELAILVALVARVWATVVDVLLVAGCLAVDYASGDRILLSAIRGGWGAKVSGDPSEVGDP